MQISGSNRLVWDLPLEKGIEALAEIGYECVEIWAEPPHLFPPNFDAERTRRLGTLLHNQGLEATLHSPSWDLNISSLNPEIRRTSINLIEQSIDLAKDLEIELIVVHPGKVSSSKGEKEETYSLLVNALSELADKAQAKGVTLAIENMENRHREIVTTPSELRGLLAAVDSNTLVGVVDVAHANTILEPTQFLAECLDILGHVHISDNNGSAPTHLPLGNGTIDFEKIFQILAQKRYSGKVVIEGFVSENSVGSARKNFEFAAELIHRLNRRK